MFKCCFLDPEKNIFMTPYKVRGRRWEWEGHLTSELNHDRKDLDGKENVGMSTPPEI